MENETFWTLATDLAHWEFELFLIILFDFVIGILLWPRLKKIFKHHKNDDDKILQLERKIEDLYKKLG
ncbi:MAG: hypothetical protein COT89_00455 [Candidatus Colwellbacteria bacterium CG10_big_fil_rev_8_21_14_0_10_42_22]|uniref:Uncharacterized protein n=1 Tax=Candidatus Colwellbacteria bacterium CG10_big_fil_rev_8_21_14_0_10_42_22 TaxID=1974540 RepID=A0A2H0VGE2_9BACT|nr:MAG: hypothetical protein COT89_00455 [Candidatus Colwellbacteria bacterium CG10_big_fil_rev_8_21_14_0_10_42_22]